MESNKKLVNVRIFGQEYPIRASSNEDYIKEVAAYVDKKMHEVQRSVPSSMNASKIAILAAMNISDELVDLNIIPEYAANIPPYKSLTFTITRRR